MATPSVPSGLPTSWPNSQPTQSGVSPIASAATMAAPAPPPPPPTGLSFCSTGRGRASLKGLPAELLLSIMELLDLSSLRSLVLASTVAHEAYRSKRESFLRSALRRTLRVVAPEAVAAHHLSKLPAYEDISGWHHAAEGHQTRAEAHQILNAYVRYGGRDPYDPALLGSQLLGDMIEMAHFHFLVIRVHATNFCNYAEYNNRRGFLSPLSAMIDERYTQYNPIAGVSLDLERHPLSGEEEARLTSALYRFHFLSRAAAKQHGLECLYGIDASICGRLPEEMIASHLAPEQREGPHSVAQYVSNSIANILGSCLVGDGSDGFAALVLEILANELSETEKEKFGFNHPYWPPHSLLSGRDQLVIQGRLGAYLQAEGLVTLSTLIRAFRQRFGPSEDWQIWRNKGRVGYEHLQGDDEEDLEDEDDEDEDDEDDGEDDDEEEDEDDGEDDDEEDDGDENQSQDWDDFD
ncbi:hypothetical protein QBC44DRAFT_373506 [Cladorrhinum sp. PSN332]|nr:hypothetical protein QBC44DRAFT_373506 [Cladorrhinum sp. PSN332]